MSLEISVSDFEIMALSLVALEPEEWIKNFIEVRAKSALEELKQKPEWSNLLSSAQAAGISISDDFAILQYGLSEGLVLTAAQVLALVQQENPPEVVSGVVSTISDRQFFQGLAIQGEITQAEALAAVKTGDLPQRLEDYIAQLPAEDQFAAQMLLSGATTFQRNHPMVALIGDMIEMTSAELDTFWNFCSTL